MQEYIKTLISVTLAAVLIITATSAIGCGGSRESRIAFVSGRDGNSEIYVMNADGTEQKNLTNNPAWDWYPSWSADGNKIAFVSHNRGGNGGIYVMNADGSGQTRLTNNPASNDTPSWSPDGERIAVASDRDGNPEIYIMNADGTEQTRLINNPAWDDSPSWSPFLTE